MDRVAVFVDAGYLFAQGSVLLHGRKLQRGEVILDHEQVIRAFADFAARVTGVPVLRIYWYDGTSTGPTPQHIALAHLDGVKVRLGFVNSVGEQKGVDSLIVTDMIDLARNAAMSDAILLSGDEDIRVGVQLAQTFGVRVHLVGIKPARGSQSLFLLQEADSTHEWGAEDIGSFLRCKPRSPSDPTAASGETIPESVDTESVLAGQARKVAFDLPEGELAGLTEAVEAGAQVPRILDARLLAGSRTVLGRDLTPTEKQAVRRLFREACAARLPQKES